MDWKELLERQSGVVSRQQALAHGVTDSALDARVRKGRWQRLYVGVYATFSGEPNRPADLAAALLRVGPKAMLSHETAAELEGLVDQPSETIHVTVPRQRHVDAIAGVRIHRSVRTARARHPARVPPRTRIEETVLDLVTGAKDLDQALSWIATACGRRLTTAGRLADAMARRSVMRWRAELEHALGDVAEGTHSLLELRYLRSVERAHGLPRGERQFAVRRGARMQYTDVRYPRYRTVV